jgi:hypothetical protein
MNITVPEAIGSSDLKVLPNGPCKAVIDKVMLGMSKGNQPKATVRWIVTSEMHPAGSKESTIGEVVLETFSLQPQAIWNLNGLYKEATGERLPQGDFPPVEFESMLNTALKGHEANLILEAEPAGPGGEDRSKVTLRS